MYVSPTAELIVSSRRKMLGKYRARKMSFSRGISSAAECKIASDARMSSIVARHAAKLEEVVLAFAVSSRCIIILSCSL